MEGRGQEALSWLGRFGEGQSKEYGFVDASMVRFDSDTKGLWAAKRVLRDNGSAQNGKGERSTQSGLEIRRLCISWCFDLLGLGMDTSLLTVFLNR